MVFTSSAKRVRPPELTDSTRTTPANAHAAIVWIPGDRQLWVHLLERIQEYCSKLATDVALAAMQQIGSRLGRLRLWNIALIHLSQNPRTWRLCPKAAATAAICQTQATTDFSPWRRRRLRRVGLESRKAVRSACGKAAAVGCPGHGWNHRPMPWISWRRPVGGGGATGIPEPPRSLRGRCRHQFRPSAATNPMPQGMSAAEQEFKDAAAAVWSDYMAGTDYALNQLAQDLSAS